LLELYAIEAAARRILLMKTAPWLT
jgi:hypothetical protein